MTTRLPDDDHVAVTSFDVTCPWCGHGPTRVDITYVSGERPRSQEFRCTACGHEWRRRVA